MRQSGLIRELKDMNPEFNFKSYDLKILDEKDLIDLKKLRGIAFERTLKDYLTQAGVKKDQE